MRPPCRLLLHNYYPHLWRPSMLSLGTILFLLYTADLLAIITKHGLQRHLYADDSRVYDFCRPNSTDVQHLRSVSTNCISDIADWMKCNRLQLNSSKSEFIWCSSSRRLK